MVVETSGTCTAVNALVVASGAQPNDDVPAYQYGPNDFEDDWGWEDEEEPPELTYASGEVQDIAHKVNRYIPKLGQVFVVWVT